MAAVSRRIWCAKLSLTAVFALLQGMGFDFHAKSAGEPDSVYQKHATEFFCSQLSRLYIADIEKNLIWMCRAEKFPNLKTWLRGFKIGTRRYLSIEHYLRRIESHQAKLKVPFLHWSMETVIVATLCSMRLWST